MNRKQRRALQKEQHAYVMTFARTLTPIPESEWPYVVPRPIMAWKSRDYLVQFYDVEDEGAKRLTIGRTRIGIDGRYQDNITWDEMQAIKRELGFGDWYGIEVYPRECDLVNVANLRHMWLLSKPLKIGWFNAEVSHD